MSCKCVVHLCAEIDLMVMCIYLQSETRNKNYFDIESSFVFFLWFESVSLSLVNIKAMWMVDGSAHNVFLAPRLFLAGVDGRFGLPMPNFLLSDGLRIYIHISFC